MGKITIISSNSPYRNLLPYPAIRVRRPNLTYAEIIMSDYASGASELTAIMQYLYHDITEPEYADVQTMLLEIAKVEMDHLHILGETIALLGGNPVFACGTPLAFWSGDDVAYGCTLCEKLSEDLKAEIKAIWRYNQHIAQIDDSFVKAILARIRMDEEVHAALLRQALSTYCSGHDR